MAASNKIAELHVSGTGSVGRRVDDRGRGGG